MIPTIDQLHLEQQADMLEIEEAGKEQITSDILRAVLIGSEYTEAMMNGHNKKANQLLGEVSLMVSKYT